MERRRQGLDKTGIGQSLGAERGVAAAIGPRRFLLMRRLLLRGIDHEQGDRRMAGVVYTTTNHEWSGGGTQVTLEEFNRVLNQIDKYDEPAKEQLRQTEVPEEDEREEARE